MHKECQRLSETVLDGVLVVLHYNANAKKLLQQIKYYLYFSFAKYPGVMMEKKWKILREMNIKVDHFVPVPLHWYKKNKRGFNQAELLINEMKEKPSNCLKRKKYSKSQVKMKKTERITNVENIFECKQKLDGKTIVLVDDVMTSGATLESCARTLKNSGAKNVIGLVWASD